ncbi:stromal membrane-associated protein [Stemphylium lycopersici]|uniref:Stromal membrane-associated protein n=1 Tax=Stemphylium lycopersici TaxID=183478 RepID=A0A364N9S5_STELY|nr:stromal membrane-associated protein [Stemphylium lycopersici]RAR12397.1 stromal membrane-associated protein [Stemphylium lycopersici]RAR13761.1 stromal membrane-associated protein [Stemphylium lycopersici]
MSRRPNPAADRAEQNRATLKNLVKLEGNKTCSDCKRNKHPRWASWNLGVFICIRCSGIHRGMGTHISRVKSVDLDTWTDEQLQSVLKWGNARANKYWESKLAPGHVPSEAKIENFIRTKYESKRWVMDGPMPDPSTLEADDDDLPLKKVQEKVVIERSASQRLAQGSGRVPPPQRQTQPQPAIDLFGDDPVPQRPSTGPPVAARAPPKAETAPPKQHKAGDSLLGLDFLGGASSAAPPRPSSTGPAAAAPSRPDLKQSILSLYAAKPAAPPQPQQHARQDSFGGLASPQAQTSPQQSAFGGMNDAFSSLSFSAAPAPAPKPSPFSGLDSFSSAKSPPTTSSSNMFGGGGNFFDSKPAPQSQSQSRTMSPAGGIGNFSAFSSPASSKPPASAASGMGDLLDLSMPSAPAPEQRVTSPPLASPPVNSAFNLSSPAPAPKAAPAPPAVNYSGFSNMDAWGSNDVWGSAAPSQPAATSTAPATTPSWGAPQVAQDDDFGGWSSAAPTTTTTNTTSTTSTTQGKPAAGFGGASDDLFSNVWE